MTDLLILSGPLAVLLAATAFIAIYSRQSWRSSRYGRMMMAGAVAVAMLAWSYVMARLDEVLPANLWPIHGWARSIAWWGVAGVYAWKAHQVHLIRKRAERDRQN